MIIMYSLELSLRYSPFPLSIQKKEFDDVKRIYDEIKTAMNETLESSNLIELSCDKVQDKLITVRVKEIISVQPRMRRCRQQQVDHQKDVPLTPTHL